MSTQMVCLERVTKRYSAGRIALENINFELAKGEFAYITGVNGAGKTTLLKLLFAIEQVSQGSIIVNNRDISHLAKTKIPNYRQEVGFVFQDFKLLPDLTIYENIGLPLEIRKMKKSEIDYRVKGVLSLINLSERGSDYPLSLSAGEQQRVAIARSIIAKPALLLADEPTGNLDSQTTREIMSLLHEIHEMGTTVIIATHDESVLEEYPARIIELKQGQVVSDSVSEVDA